MSVIIVLAIISIIVAGSFLIAFIWSVKSGQYEDTYTPSVRILFDENEKRNEQDTKATTFKENLKSKRI